MEVFKKIALSAYKPRRLSSSMDSVKREERFQIYTKLIHNLDHKIITKVYYAQCAVAGLLSVIFASLIAYFQTFATEGAMYSKDFFVLFLVILAIAFLLIEIICLEVSRFVLYSKMSKKDKRNIYATILDMNKDLFWAFVVGGAILCVIILLSWWYAKTYYTL